MEPAELTSDQVATLDRLYHSIGLITARWALIEMSLEVTISTIFHNVDQDKRCAPRVPVPLERKCAYLRRAVDLSLVEEERRALDSLLLGVNRLSEYRNHLVHAALVAFKPTGVLELTRM